MKKETKRSEFEMYPVCVGAIAENTCNAALILKHLIGYYCDVEKQAARNKALSKKLRKEASRRATLLENARIDVFNIVDMIIDAEADDGVADLEAKWKLDDKHYDKEDAQNV